MDDTLRAKMRVLLVASLAFAGGLALASGLDLTPIGLAAGGPGAERPQSVPDLQIGAPAELSRRLSSAPFSRGFSDVAERVSDAVVTIQVEKQVEGRRLRIPHRLPSPFDDFFEREDGESRDPPEPRILPGSGSGFVVSPQGYIVTNNHVVENAETITLQLADRREIDDVELVGRDPTTDVALLKVDASGLTAAPLGHADSLRVGDWVLAIGSPGFADNLLQSTVTAGIVSATGRNINVLASQLQRQGLDAGLAIEDFIQTDAVINQGNSGGPLVNARGEVVGVNTAILSETGTYQGYGFAVPIELVRDVIDDLVRYGEVRRPVLGILVGPVSSADARYYGLDRVAGAQVTGFPSDQESPAQVAGVHTGDVIVAVEGETVESVADLQRKIRARSAGETVRVTVVRRDDRSRETVRVTLAAADSPREEKAREAERTVPSANGDALGLEVAELDEEVRQELRVPPELSGVVITGSDPRSPLARELPADPTRTVIVDVNGREIGSVAEYRDAVSELDPGDVANLRLYLPQSGQQLFLTVEVSSD